MEVHTSKTVRYITAAGHIVALEQLQTKDGKTDVSVKLEIKIATSGGAGGPGAVMGGGGGTGGFARATHGPFDIGGLEHVYELGLALQKAAHEGGFMPMREPPPGQRSAGGAA